MKKETERSKLGLNSSVQKFYSSHNMNIQVEVNLCRSEWLLFNANSAIFQLYHGENKLIFYCLYIDDVLLLEIWLSRWEGWDPINWLNPATFLRPSQVRTWISNIICHGLFSVQLRCEVVVHFVDIGEIDDLHCVNFLFITITFLRFRFISCKKKKPFDWSKDWQMTSYLKLHQSSAPSLPRIIFEYHEN